MLLFHENYGRLPDLVGIDFLKPQREVHIKVSNKSIENARKILQNIIQKTSSADVNDYPCTCGGWCENDFLRENG